jgi:NitT/TauT family transport system permease protein/taurine transport system permease protein
MANSGADGRWPTVAFWLRRSKAEAVFWINRRTLTGFITLLALVLLWYLLTDVTGVADRQRVPSPTEIIDSAEQILFEGYAGGTLLVQAYHSVRLVFLGFLVAVVTGVPLGLAMGLSPRFEALVNPAFLLVRPIPPLAWIPLAIVWFGLGDSAKILVIWFAAFVPAVINSHVGVRTVDPVLIEAARVHGGSRSEILSDVLLPGAMPMIFTGLRLSLQASWTTLVAAELVGAFFGLGRVLMSAYRDINPAMIATAMIAVGVLGAVMMKLLALIERSVLRWRTP